MGEQLFEWILAIVGSGGLGATIMWFVTFKSRQKLAKMEADEAEIEVELKKEDLHQDQYDYLQKTCDKYIKDYHELESDFRKQISELRLELDAVLKDKITKISDKCNEIAKLKSEIVYLKGIRCYNFTCQHRVKENPDKVKQ